MTSFGNALRSEWTKMASLRSTWIFVVLLVGSIAGPVVLLVSIMESGMSVGWQQLTIGMVIFTMIAVAYGGSSLAGEYNDQMHAHAFLTEDRRSLWLVARGLLVTVLLAVTWVVGLGVGYLAVVIAPGISFDGGAATENLKGVLSFVVFGFIAMALGVLTRSRVAAVSIPLVWMLVVEQLLGYAALMTKMMVPVWLAAPGVRIAQLAEQVGDGGAGGVGGAGGAGSMGASTAGEMEIFFADPPGAIGFGPENTQPLWFNVSVLVAWVVLCVAVALWVNQKRDVK